MREIRTSAYEGLRWISEQQMTVKLRFVGYVEGLVSVIGHADRAGPLRDYCVGLMLMLKAQERRADGGGDGT